MREIRITLDEKDFKEVLKAKKFLKTNWRNFILILSKDLMIKKEKIWDK